MSESGFFSGLSVVIVADKNEPIDWLSNLVSTARREASEIIIVIEQDADPLRMRPTIGSFERVRLLFQQGSTKADALNTGLQSAKNTFVAFVDADVVLEPGMLETVLAILEGDADHDAAEFVSVGYGARSPSFAPIGFVAGWFFGARRSVFIEIGGWASGYVEDVETAKRISRSGHKIAIAPFAVKLRRPVRRPMTKLLSVLTSFGRRES